jgi:hypothetical protein
MKSKLRALLLAMLTAIVPHCTNGDDDGLPAATLLCDAADLVAALRDAVPGDVVRVGACTVAGSFTVPAGVALRGADRSTSVIASVDGRPAVRLVPGAEPARLSDIRVRSAAHTGIFLVAGEGGVAVERVAVDATRGIALGGEGVDSVVLTDVALMGPVTPENELSIPPLATAEETATHGLLLARVGSAILTDVSATGFASFGALLVSVGTTWDGGGTTANRGVGLMVQGGTATLAALDLSGTLGEGTPIPSYGGVFAGGARIETTAVVVSGGRNFGLLHDGVAARHTGLVANDNYEAGVWVQSCPSFELHGGEIWRNGLAGLLLLETGATQLDGLRSGETRFLPTVFGETGRVDIGAGVEIVRPGGPVRMVASGLLRNEQVGVLVHLASSATMDGISFEDVTVEGAGMQYGAIAQGGRIDAGWDAGLTRDAITTANDAAVSGLLDRAGALSAGDMPAVAEVVDRGIVGVIDPDPPF